MNTNSKWIMGLIFYCGILLPVLGFLPVLSSAGEIDFDLGVTASIVSQNVDTENESGGNDEGFDVINRVLTPSAAINFDGRALDFRAQGSVEYLDRNLNGESVTTNLSEFDYNGRYQAVENLLSFTASGSQRYQSSRLQSFNVDDLLINSENLVKITSHQLGTILSLPRRKYLGMTLSGDYSSVDSNQDRLQQGPLNSSFDNESFSSSLMLISGTGLKNIRSTFTGSTNYVKRGNDQNFTSQRASLDNNFIIYKDFGLVANAYYENNEIESQVVDNSSPGLREFYSAGAGFFWQPARSRYFEIAYNQSTTVGLNEEQDEDDSFLSYRLNWAFSNRTSVTSNYTRRFFGDSGSFSLRHNLRNWRSSISYNETVTSRSRLLTTNELGLFVCEIGSVNISECSLSDSLEPDLQNGQVIVPVNVQGFEINDRIVLRKSLTAQTAVTRRRTTLSIVATRNDLDDFEVNNTNKTNIVSTNVSFGLSARTTATLGHSYSSVESVRNGDNVRQIVNQVKVDLSRKLSRNLTTSFGLSYLKRRGEAVGFSNQFIGLNGPLSDKRVTARLSYRFGSNR